MSQNTRTHWHRNSKHSRSSARPWMRRIFAHIEFLETRTLLSVSVAPTGKTATYTDVDGDIVTVAVSKGTLTSGLFTNAVTGELQVLDLTAPGFAGANLTVTVKRAGNGDGLANIGYINASGNDLGTVSIAGDLGRIDAGDAITATPAIKSLTVRTLGRFGLDSQGGTGTLTSNIFGALTALSVKGDVTGALVSVSGGANGSIGAITIGGSLIGGDADDSGEILATGNIGTVKIARDIQGGGGVNSGDIRSSAGKVGTTTVGGSIIGGAGDGSGVVRSNLTLGLVTVTHDIEGGSGAFSGAILDSGALTGATIGGSVIGGTGQQSGEIFSGAAIGIVKITQNLAGGDGGFSGSIQATAGALAGLTIGGSLIGGDGVSSGYVKSTADMGAVKISHDLLGGTGSSTGTIISGGKLTSLSVGGSLIGAVGDNSGQVNVTTTLGAVVVGGDIHGGSGVTSGFIRSGTGAIASVTVGGSIIGGDAHDTGKISAGGDLGTVKIGHDVQGGAGNNSGQIQSGAGNIAGITISGSLIGGTGSSSGAILSDLDMGAIAIAQDIRGGSISGTSSTDSTGCIISGGRISSVTVGGSIYAGINTGTGLLTNSGAIRAQNDIGALTVKGSLIGNQNATANTAVVISARGQAVQGATTDLAIGKITIGGRVEFTNILAGYDITNTALNPDAQIGAVAVAGDWIASNLVAGAMNANSDNVEFGDSNDAKISGVQASPDSPTILSTITSITIKGIVIGTPAATNPADQFGFVAESVKALSVNGVKITLNTAPHTDDLSIGLTGDVTLHEI